MHTFAFVALRFLLGICSLSTRLIKGKEVKSKVTEFKLYSEFFLYER